MAATKNKQSAEVINAISKKTFPEKNLEKFTEFTAGYCNVSYLLEFDDGFKAVLKVSSKDSTGFMRNETGLMDNEVQTLNLVYEKLSVKTPKIYLYDDSCTVCSGKYFVMDYIPGTDYWSVKENLSNDEKNEMDIQIGKLVKEISFIESDYFGSVGNPECRFESLYDLVYHLLDNALLDAEEKNIDLTTTSDEIRKLFEENKKFFEFTEAPSLVHYDLWEGNIFIEENKISGVIDWERAMFADPLMEDRFRLEKYTPAFFDGYGQSQFSFREIRRLLWYDLILYLSMMTEGAFRGYEDTSIYDFAFPIYKQSLDMIKETF